MLPLDVGLIQISEKHSVAFGLGWGGMGLGGVPEINMFKKGLQANDCINTFSDFVCPFLSMLISCNPTVNQLGL